MKNKWQIKKIKDVCGFQNGFAFKGNLFKDSGLPVLRISNIQNNGVSSKNLVFFDKKNYKDNLNKYIVTRGDLIIAMSGATTGKLAIVDTDEIFYLNQRVGKFEPKNDLLKKYLYYFLSTKIEENLRISLGSAQPNLSTEQIKNIEIPFPPFSEQKRITKILDLALEKLQKVKEITENNLQDSKSLFESCSDNIFSDYDKNWESKKMKEVCEKITDGTHQTPKYFNEGVIFLSSRNVTSGKIDWKNIKYIDQKQHLEMHKRVSPRKGDILLAKNGTTGIAAMVDEDIIFNIYVSLAHIRCLDIILPKFMLYFINSPVAKKQFNKRLKGSGVPNLHLEEIREVEISFPKSISDQKSIVKKLDLLSEQTKKLESIYKKKLLAIEELKKSILQKAFSGEL